MKNKTTQVIIVLCLLFLSGCWDQVEIEENAFLAAVAIDLADEQEGKRMFEMTQQLVVPSGLGSILQSATGKAFQNVSATGETIYNINTDISRKTNRKANVEHLGLVLVSEELAREKDLFANVLDVFVRQQFMRRGVLVAITEGKAKDYLDIEPEHLPLPSQYITQLLENGQTSLGKDPVRVGDIQEDFLIKRSFVLPYISQSSNKSVNYNGVSIMKEPASLLIENLTYDVADGRHFIMGEKEEGSVVVELEGEPATFTILTGESTYTLTNDNKDSLTFHVDIKLTTMLREYFGTVDLERQENAKKFEKALEEKVKSLAEDTLKIVKDEVKVDVLDFHTYLRTRHYALWEEIKDDWDKGENYFSKSEMNFQINVDMLEPGSSTEVNKE